MGKIIKCKIKSKGGYDQNENPVNIHVKDLILIKKKNYNHYGPDLLKLLN